MPTTRKWRSKHRVQSNTRRKVKPKVKPWKNRLFQCCQDTGCLVEEPTMCIPDFTYKDHAEELMARLQGILRDGTLTDDGYTYMVLGYASMIKSKYKKSIDYFNVALNLSLL